MNTKTLQTALPVNTAIVNDWCESTGQSFNPNYAKRAKLRAWERGVMGGLPREEMRKRALLPTSAELSALREKQVGIKRAIRLLKRKLIRELKGTVGLEEYEDNPNGGCDCQQCVAERRRAWEASRRRNGRPEQARRLFRSPGLKGKLVSVEIEYYPVSERPPQPVIGGKPSDPIEWQTVKYDGSLADHGREVCRTSIAPKLAGLWKMHLVGAANSDCGLHVHVDMRHLAPREATRVYCRLVAMYDFLALIVPESRLINKYCSFEVQNHPEIAYVYSTYSSPVRQSSGRYCAVNWLAYQEHKTLEFRCFAGSVQPAKIAQTASLCWHLVRIAGGNVVPETVDGLVELLPDGLGDWYRSRVRRFGRSEQLNVKTPCKVALAKGGTLYV